MKMFRRSVVLCHPEMPGAWSGLTRRAATMLIPVLVEHGFDELLLFTCCNRLPPFSRREVVFSGMRPD